MKIRRSPLLVLLLAVSIGLGILAWHSGWLVRTSYQLMIALSDDTGKRLGLENYRVDIDGVEIQGVSDNASGLTYHAERNTLFSVINRPPQIIELRTDGTLLRTIAVRGVIDLEGITHIRDNQFFIADEATHQLIHIEINDGQSEIDASDRPRIGLAIDQAQNTGFEGISWDHSQRRLFVVKEKQPLRLLELSGLDTLLGSRQIDLQIREWVPSSSAALMISDLSSLTYHEESGNMLILSDESRLIVELGSHKRASGLLVLQRGWHGLKNDVPQAEGICVGRSGEIYVISEPNLFYRFAPPAGGQSPP